MEWELSEGERPDRATRHHRGAPWAQAETLGTRSPPGVQGGHEEQTWLPLRNRPPKSTLPFRPKGRKAVTGCTVGGGGAAGARWL